MSEEKKGIGGFLLLPAIGIAINPVLLIVGILKGTTMWIGPQGIAATTELKATGAALILGEFVLLGLAGVLAFKFFQTKRETPQWFFAFQWANAAFNVMAFLAINTLGGETAKLAQNAITALLGAIFWTIYFKRSKRVANTFVN